MNVKGVGGAASLPMTMAGTPPVPPAGTAGSGGTAGPPGITGATGTGGAGGPTGDVRLPGQAKAGAGATGSGSTSEAAAKHKEAPKPAPLPPLRGLTVAEIRAMLGVAPLPGQAQAAASTGGTSIITAVLNRYV
jgi:hypothetical protein